LNIDVQMVPGKGTRDGNNIKTEDHAFAILAEDIPKKLHYVMDAITLTRKELNGRVCR
jgi:uroporphyrinogen decarboxylase